MDEIISFQKEPLDCGSPNLPPCASSLSSLAAFVSLGHLFLANTVAAALELHQLPGGWKVDVGMGVGIGRKGKKMMGKSERVTSSTHTAWVGK